MTSDLGHGDVGSQPFGVRTEGGDKVAEEDRMKKSVNDALKQAFRPEFLNRIDDTVIFHPLDQEQIVQVVGLMVIDVQERVTERGITFELTEAARDWLAKEGFDAEYGARPLRRAIQRYLENPLSKGLLSGDFREGDHVVVDAGAGGLELATRSSEKEGAQMAQTA